MLKTLKLWLAKCKLWDMFEELDSAGQQEALTFFHFAPGLTSQVLMKQFQQLQKKHAQQPAAAAVLLHLRLKAQECVFRVMSFEKRIFH